MNFKQEKETFLKKFNNQGFVKIKNVFSKKDIKKIKYDLFHYLTKQSFKIKKRYIHFADKTKYINSVHNLKWKKLRNLQKNSKITQVVRFLLNEDIKKFGAEVFAKPARVGMPSPVHQDNYYWNLNNSKGVTVWIALDKSTKNNGAIFYYKKSHKIGLLNHISSYAPGSSQKLKNLKILKKYKKITPSLNIGDILIHHCLILHGSNKNTSKNNRTGLTLRYIAKSSKILKESKLKYEKKLKEQLKKIN